MRCSSCKADVTPTPPHTSRKIAVVGFWIASMVTAVMFSLLLGLNVMLVPLWFCIGSAVGVAARRAHRWSCPECHEELVVNEPVVPAGYAPPLVARPA